MVEPDFQEIAAATIRIKNPYHAFSRALGLFYQPPSYAPGIHPTAVIDSTAEIGADAHIGAYVVIGPNVRLGSHATLLPHVVLYPGVQAGSHFFAHAHAVVRENCVLGDHVTLENGAIIGADGFGFAKERSWPMGEDSAIRSGAYRQPRRRAGQRHHRPRHRGRDGNRRRNEGRQSRPGRPRLARRREHAALRADRPGGFLRHRQQCDSGRPGGRRRPLHHRRWRHPHRAIGRLARCAARKNDLRIAGFRQPHLAARGHHLPTLAGVAQAPGPRGEGGGKATRPHPKPSSEEETGK